MPERKGKLAFTLAATTAILLLCLQVAPTIQSTQLSNAQDSTVTSSSTGSEPIPLYIGTLQPTSVHWWASYGRYFVDFLQWVFDNINARRDILPGYTLRLEWRDTQVRRTTFIT
ncbi:hypothetical protein ElyMa_004208700 [Elysia marginata]|uniref:Uncharacterized protein n=1 Tax=Elysia marginata TaxID=1093978 RepID=A0AAV4GMU3_9GAST|nr:hypothetical protein ElyMa_004208700 [Elysia marginata]